MRPHLHEEEEEGGGEPGSCRDSQPALASASLSKVTSAKSRFIAAALYEPWATNASMTRTDFQGMTGLIDARPSGVLAPLLAG